MKTMQMAKQCINYLSAISSITCKRESPTKVAQAIILFHNFYDIKNVNYVLSYVKYID